MTEEASEEPQSAEDVDAALSEAYGELLDANKDILMSVREKTHQLMELKDRYFEQAALCDEIAELHIKGAQVIASTFGDIITNEWGVGPDDEETDGDEDDTEQKS